MSQLQLDTLTLVSIIAGCSALYCFIVGELTRNNSQMDKLWSILPEVYAWVIAIKGGMAPRLVIMAILATIWGIRLTINFGRKGAYKLKFWSGEEDYRWKLLRQHKLFKSKLVWALFDLLFISIYQNFLVLLTTLPAVAAMDSKMGVGVVDIIAAILMILCILYETIADEQMWRFQCKKRALLMRGKTVGEMPDPYNIGFCTIGLWNHSRHPNYLAEQSTWVCFYLFSVGAGAGIINWSIAGVILLILLFWGSSTLTESISKSKYPRYTDYQKKVPRFLFWKRFR